jgi:hypothetical protein
MRVSHIHMVFDQRFKLYTLTIKKKNIVLGAKLSTWIDILYTIERYKRQKWGLRKVHALYLCHIHSGEPDLDSLIPTFFPLHAYISTFMI